MNFQINADYLDVQLYKQILKHYFHINQNVNIASMSTSRKGLPSTSGQLDDLPNLPVIFQIYDII